MYVLICLDREGASEIRSANRAAHLAYVEKTGVVSFAGPFLSDDGQSMIGSLIVLNVVTRAEAETWAENDPYAQAGLFGSVTVRRFKQVVG